MIWVFAVPLSQSGERAVLLSWMKERGREGGRPEFNQLRGKGRYVWWSHHSHDAQPAVQNYAEERWRGRGQSMEESDNRQF